MVQSYRDLWIWQQAVDLVPEVYAVVERLPKEERYALADQMRRAAVSVSANIAEGHERQHTKEFIQYLCIANGSLAELDTLFTVAVRLNYLAETDGAQMEKKLRGLRLLIQTLVRRLQQKLSPVSAANSPCGR